MARNGKSYVEPVDPDVVMADIIPDPPPPLALPLSLPIVNTEDDEARGFEPSVSVICGPQKTGKSSAAASWPNPVALDTEDGLAWVRVKRQFEDGSGSVSAPIPRIRIPEKQLLLPRRRMAGIIEWIEQNVIDLLRETEQPYGTFIVDTVDELWRVVSEAFMSDQGLSALSPKDHYTPIYNALLPLMRQMFDLKKFGYHVVFVCHTTEREAEDGGQPVHRLSTPGKLSEMLLNLGDELFYMYPDYPTGEARKEAQEKRLDVNPKPNRFLAKYTERYPSGDRSGLLKPIIPATFGAIDACMRGETDLTPYVPDFSDQPRKVRTAGAAYFESKEKKKK